MLTRRVSFGLDPPDLAREFGTPLYIINLDALEYNFIRLHRALLRADIDHKIFYAAKANPLLAVLRRVLQLGGGAEVVSLGEMEAAKRAGFSPGDVVFNGPGKSMEEIEAAVKWGVRSLNVESVQELHTIAEACKKLGRVAGVGFRINPGVAAKTHGYLRTGFRGSKFGLDPPSFREALRFTRKSKSLNPVCVHMHFGSQIGRPSDFRVAYRALMQCVNVYRKVLRKAPQIIDVGGGLGFDYAKGKPPLQPENYVSKVVKPVVQSRAWPDSSELVVEPGRYLVAQAGILAMRVLYVKKASGVNWVITDCGMSDFMRTALYSDEHRIINASRSSGRRQRYSVGGPTCESGDTFGCYDLPKTESGDMLLLLDAGAYGSAMSSNYNGRLRPATVAVSEGKAWPCERRETLEDLFGRQPHSA
ncbi:MAG TPA: diaminopimelate decarboxylase [Thermoproteota archaeon]|nr:diaminopimelate decarboxylase [Thermoproteota archaeon]